MHLMNLIIATYVGKGLLFLYKICLQSEIVSIFTYLQPVRRNVHEINILSEYLYQEIFLLCKF